MDTQRVADLERLLHMYRAAIDAVCVMAADGPAYRTHDGTLALMPKRAARSVLAALHMDGRDVLPF